MHGLFSIFVSLEQERTAGILVSFCGGKKPAEVMLFVWAQENHVHGYLREVEGL